TRFSRDWSSDVCSSDLGTIGGSVGESLSPLDVVKFTAAFGTFIKNRTEKNKIVIGRDARLSGETVSKIVASTLQSLGLHVVDLDLSTTPTVEIAGPLEQAAGGIIITASHNPIQWNALKLLNQDGEFISEEEGLEILKIAEQEAFEFADVKKLGSYEIDESYTAIHIEKILRLPLVDVEAIKERNFRIAIDCVNSTGGIVIPRLLKALGVKNVTEIYCEPRSE